MRLAELAALALVALMLILLVVRPMLRRLLPPRRGRRPRWRAAGAPARPARAPLPAGRAAAGRPRPGGDGQPGRRRGGRSTLDPEARLRGELVKRARARDRRGAGRGGRDRPLLAARELGGGMAERDRPRDAERHREGRDVPARQRRGACAASCSPSCEIDEIKEITQAMSRLGVVPGEVVEALLRDFVERLGSAGGLIGSYDTTERLLGQVLDPTRSAAIMEDVRGPAGRTVWDKLGNVDESVLAAYLKNEYPQTIAVVLSKIRSEHAARVLASLPEEAAIETVLRMLRMEVVQKDILDDVEQTLRAEFMSNLARTQPARQSRDHGRDLQLPRPLDRGPLPRSCSRSATRRPPTGSAR